MKKSTLFKLYDGSIMIIPCDNEMYILDKKDITFYTPETMLNKYIKFVNDINSKTKNTYLTNTKLIFDKNCILHIKKQSDNGEEIDITSTFKFFKGFEIEFGIGEEKIVCLESLIFLEGYWVYHCINPEKITTLFEHIFCYDNMIIEAKRFTRIGGIRGHIQLTPRSIIRMPYEKTCEHEVEYIFKNYTEYSKFVRNQKISQKLKNVVTGPELFRATLRGESTKWIGRMNFRKKDRIKCDISFKFS